MKMNAEQRESIESEFFHRWVFQEELFQKYLDKLDDMTWLDDEADDEIDDENIIESLPVNINVEKLVGISFNFFLPDFSAVFCLRSFIMSNSSYGKILSSRQWRINVN